MGLWVEEKYAEGSVEEAVVDVAHLLAGLLRGRAEGAVVDVEDDTGFVYEPNLFSIVAQKVAIVRVAIQTVVSGGDGATITRLSTENHRSTRPR